MALLFYSPVSTTHFPGPVRPQRTGAITFLPGESCTVVCREVTIGLCSCQGKWCLSGSRLGKEDAQSSTGDQSQPSGGVSLLPQSATSVPSTSSSTEGHISNSDSPATVPMTIVTGTIYPETPSHEDLMTGPASFHLLPSSWELAQTQGIPNSLSLISCASSLQRSPLPPGHPQITWRLL